MNVTQRSLRLIALSGLVAGALLAPAAANAQSSAGSATVVGRVTCGPDEESAAPRAVISIEGMNLISRTDASGAFMLGGIPASQNLTLDASTDGFTVSRYNITLQPGQTLDIGSLDLATCPRAPETIQSPTLTSDELTSESSENSGE
jgi:carboxypeptidase family protein